MKNTKTSKRKVISFIIAAALVLSLGTVGALAAANASQSNPGVRIVTEEEYALIQSGEISLDDGMPRLWSSPGSDLKLVPISDEQADERASFTVTLNNPGVHVVTEEEYALIQSGEISLDDGVPRLWSSPGSDLQLCIISDEQAAERAVFTFTAID